MNSLYFGPASPEEEEAVIDFINLVFSHAHRPHDFPALLPKLYRPGNFDARLHYIAREGGAIRALVGAYPLEARVGDETLRLRGIGAVSVHPYHEHKGYMRRLMALALEDMVKDEVDLAFLGGQRQRYQYFGFEQAGVAVSFTVNRAGMRHVLGPEAASPLTLRQVERGDGPLLEAMRALHDRQPVHALRPADRFYDILCSWDARPWAVLRDGACRGYAVANGARGFRELVLADEEDLYPFLIAWFRDQAPEEVDIAVGLHETARLRALSRLCENYHLRTADQFRVFNFERVIRAFLKLRASYETLPDGVWSLRLAGGAFLVIAVAGGVPRVETASPGERLPEAPAFSLEDTRLLFSPAAFFTTPSPAPWLPLPLFLSPTDGV